MILDDVQPTWDGRRIESRLAPAPDAVRSNRAVRALFAIRCGIERLVSAVLRRTVAPMAEPTTLKLVDIPRRRQWVKPGEDSPSEIALRAIGRFWAGETIWQNIDAVDFLHFSLPGNVKIGCHRGFLRYWRLVSPRAGVMMRSTLSVIARNVNRAGCEASRREKACV